MPGNAASDRNCWKVRTTLFLWGPPVIVLFLILTLSLTPGTLYPEHPEIFNVTIHFAEFVLLTFFLARALATARRGSVWGSVALTVFIGTLAGLMTELLQFTVPNRMFDLMDIVVDFSGALTGALIYASIVRTKVFEQPDAGIISGTDDV